MTGEREYISIDRALNAQRVPLGNHTFIKGFLHKVGIEGVYESGGLIVAVRRDGGMSLNIARGSTNGFLSEDEVIEVAAADARREPSTAGRGWRVIHPEDPGGRESGPMAGATAKRRGGPCPECGFELSLSGTCGNPDCSLYG